MRLARRRLDTPRLRAGRHATAAVIVAALGAAAFAPSASAGPVEDVTAIVQDFVGNGDITSCRFTKPQLQYVRSQLGPDWEEYVPDFVIEVDREIARWTSGACNGGTAGNGGGQQGASRATIVSLKVAKNRASVKVKLKCPASASSSCKIKLSGKLASKKAASNKSSTVARGSSKTVTVKLTKATARKLRSKGGKLRISAKTVGSSLAAVSRIVKLTPGA